jgi:hypothetical protein
MLDENTRLVISKRFDAPLGAHQTHVEAHVPLDQGVDPSLDRKVAGVWVPRTQASFECFAQNARSAQSFHQRLVQPSAKSASAATVVVTVLRGRGQQQRFRINTR